MSFWLIRHAEPDLNLKQIYFPRFEGNRHDFMPLSPKGKEETRKLAEKLRNLEISFIISSPYTRCLETAAILSKELFVDLQVEMDLHEWMPVKNRNSIVDYNLVAEKHREFEQHMESFVLPIDRTWESIREVKDRIVRVMNHYHSGKNILVVTHDGVIRILLNLNLLTDPLPFLSVHSFDLDVPRGI